MNSIITAVTHFTPSNLIHNFWIENKLRNSNPHINIPLDIITVTTGINTRYFGDDLDYNSTLASQAAKKLFQEYNIIPSDIDLIIFASAGQDMIEPATAHIIQDNLKTNAKVFDIKNACNAFIDSLAIADSFIKTMSFNKILILSGEVSSKAIKWDLKDRNDFKNSFAGYTFGDMGTAVLVESTKANSGIQKFQHFTDSSYWEAGTLSGGGSRNPRGDEYMYFKGDGAKLKVAVEKKLKHFFHEFMIGNNLYIKDVDYICMHQVSQKYLSELLHELDIPKNIVVDTVSTYGNVASCSIPLQLSLLNKKNMLKSKDNILFLGIAGGMSITMSHIIW